MCFNKEMLAPGTALLIVDVQRGFGDPGWGPRTSPAAELRAAWRGVSPLVFHARHLSAVPDACAASDREGPDRKVFPAEKVHEVSLASLHGEFAEVVSSGPLLSELEAGNGTRR